MNEYTTYTHKQTNFFLGFPMYVCLGTYYVLNLLASPFIKLWDASSKKLYETINSDIETSEEFVGANMTVGEQSDKNNSTVDVNRTEVKEVKVSPQLMEQREKLIKELDETKDTRNNKVVAYKYTALNPQGKMITAVFVAFSKQEVYNFLEGEGYKVFKIETSKSLDRFYNSKSIFSHRIKTRDIIFWLEQLSTYLKSGIPLTDAMRILTRQMGKNLNIKRIFDSVVYNLTLGESFSTALEKQGDAFPRLLINMIKSAEVTGDLEATLDDMANYYRETETTRKDMIQAITYPALVFVFAIAVIIFLLVYLIPKFVMIYNTAGATLNPVTSFIIAVSNALRENFFFILIVILTIIIVLIVLYKSIKAVRYTMQKIAMKLPIIGKIIIYKEMTIFTKTFASLLKNNVYITESMDMLEKITNNEIYKQIMINTLDCISRGENISTAFKDNWAIPDVAYYMMVTGESTGQLAEMMERVAEYYEEQHRMLVNTIKTLLEPALIIFLAVVVGFIIIAVFVPIFGLYQQIT